MEYNPVRVSNIIRHVNHDVYALDLEAESPARPRAARQNNSTGVPLTTNGGSTTLAKVAVHTTKGLFPPADERG